MNESPQFAAHAVANNTVLELIEAGIPADDIADALMTKGLAVWAADTGRHTAARELLRVWTEVRDYGR